MVGGILTSTPAINRWGTCGEHVAEQTAGCMFHRILPKTLSTAFRRWDAADENNEEVDDDHRLMMRKKAWRAKLRNSNPDYQKHLAVSCWLTIPAEHLLMKVQKLDSDGGGLQDVMSEKRSPFNEAQHDLTDMIDAKPEESPLRALFYQFARDSEDEHDGLTTTCREGVSSIICQNWFWFIKVCQNWPFRLSTMRDATRPVQERRRTGTSFWYEPDCCKDGFFSLKVKPLFIGLNEFLDDEEFQSLMRRWQKTEKLANMHNERLLALIRQGTL